MHDFSSFLNFLQLCATSAHLEHILKSFIFCALVCVMRFHLVAVHADFYVMECFLFYLMTGYTHGKLKYPFISSPLCQCCLCECYFYCSQSWEFEDLVSFIFGPGVSFHDFFSEMFLILIDVLVHVDNNY